VTATYARLKIAALEVEGFKPVVAVVRNAQGQQRSITLLDDARTLIDFLEWLATADVVDHEVPARSSS
jgi:hypothetical protein